MFNSLASLASVTNAPASLSRCPNEKRVTFSSAAASKTPQARSLLADAATKPSSWSRKAVCLVNRSCALVFSRSLSLTCSMPSSTLRTSLRGSSPTARLRNCTARTSIPPPPSAKRLSATTCSGRSPTTSSLLPLAPSMGIVRVTMACPRYRVTCVTRPGTRSEAAGAAWDAVDTARAEASQQTVNLAVGLIVLPPGATGFVQRE